MESNRESARRSRIKKQRHMEDLVNEIGFLQKEICKTSTSCEAILQMSELVKAENRLLRDEQARLEQQLSRLEWMLMNLGHDGYLADNIFQVQEPHLQPWQVHGLQQPIMASGTFNY